MRTDRSDAGDRRPGGPVVWLGRGSALEPVPEAEWWSHLQAGLPGARQRFEALSPLERAVRRAAVLRLVGTGRPVPPADLETDAAAPREAVAAALAELERRLFFLVRDPSGSVSWAFPVTANPTPHHLAFASGERLDAA